MTHNEIGAGHKMKKGVGEKISRIRKVKEIKMFLEKEVCLSRQRSAFLVMKISDELKIGNHMTIWHQWMCKRPILQERSDCAKLWVAMRPERCW